ncbi:LysM peptidoglycan-binding domain-containing protein [Jiangella ureilytica]|uniref:LysM peptidoglycan-binding domain-containing protein n=1 Tax=Jiangella ureilytica TaxID=2530374 RepID=A0A4R4RI20_9ACTN|nr:LysM peptidoglycan-binding domain-containing protein [Jiangella ureilytica]TDC48103.1 LysM peptidoglycan-binding domain-containing protein [Jiangella ureilytica]
MGLPAVLWTAGGSPLPEEWPTLAQARDAALRPDDGTLFLALLLVVGWLGWGTFVLSLIVEVPAALWGTPAPRLPGLRAQQRLVAGLVAAVAAVGSGGSAAMAESPPPGPWEPAPPVTTGLLDEPPAVGDADGRHVVADGDTLWDVADARLGDPWRYPEIAAASAATVQPDGRRLTDPDLIVPGWTLTIPGADAPASLPDTGGPVFDETGDRPGGAGEDAAGAAHGGAVGDEDEDDTGEVADLVRTTGGVGAVLAAALVGVLATRRLREQRHRRPGERLAGGTEADRATEAELRQAADPAAVEVVDRVLRGLAARVAETGRGLPPLRAVRLTRRTLELYLAAPAELPAPFAGTAHGGVWTVGLDEAPEAGPDTSVPAPYPSLVTLGHDHHDALVLLDLEQVGTLVVDGPAELVRSSLTAVAAELATSAWADDLRVTLVGAPALADLDLLDTGRVRHVTDVEGLLDELAVRVADDRLLLATAGVSGLGAARATQVADATWTPEILVIAEPLPADQWDRLEALIVTAPRVAVAAVVGGGEPGGLPSRGHRLRGRTPHTGGGTWVLRLDGPAERPVAILDPLGVPVRPQLLDDETRRRFLELLRGAGEQPVGAVDDGVVTGRPLHGGPAVPGGARPADRGRPVDGARSVDGGRPAAGVPDREERRRAAAGRSQSGRALPRLLMLGPVEVRGAAELGEQTKLGQLTELAMFIALNPGCDSNAIDEAIWPGSAVTKTTRGTAISKLRRWLGTDASGSALLPRSDSGYTLRHGIRSDWDDWRELLPDGPARATTADLRAALELVRGRPFSGRGRRRYDWADHLAQEMIASIVDACHELALRALVDGDPWEALRTALLGLTVEPGVELLWRDRLKAELALGAHGRVLDSIDKLLVTAAELGGGLEPETEVLIELIRTGRMTEPADPAAEPADPATEPADATPGSATPDRRRHHSPARSRSPA